MALKREGKKTAKANKEETRYASFAMFVWILVMQDIDSEQKSRGHLGKSPDSARIFVILCMFWQDIYAIYVAKQLHIRTFVAKMSHLCPFVRILAKNLPGFFQKWSWMKNSTLHRIPQAFTILNHWLNNTFLICFHTEWWQWLIALSFISFCWFSLGRGYKHLKVSCRPVRKCFL